MNAISIKKALRSYTFGLKCLSAPALLGSGRVCNRCVSIGRGIGRPDLKYVQFSYGVAVRGMREMGISTVMSTFLIEMSKALNDGLFAVGLKPT